MDEWYPEDGILMHWEGPSFDWRPDIDDSTRDDLTGHPDFPPSEDYSEWQKIEEAMKR